MRSVLIHIALIGWLIPAAVVAQQRDSTQTQVQEDLEQALEDFDIEEGERGSEQLIQLLQELMANPININRADVNELREVPGINLKTARAIIHYRTEEKPFETLGELTEVSGIGRVTFEKVQPYVTIGSGLELSKALYSDPRYWTNDGKLQVFSRYQQDLQKGQGYIEPPEEGGYRGSPMKYYQRFGYQSDHLSMNFTQEKDAGEQLSNPARFDHQSWHLALEDNGLLQMIAVGDYSLSFGQGLVLWNGGVFGKGSDVIGAANRKGRGIKPYTSAQETNYYRGAAATVGRRFQITGFYSARNRSSSIISPDTVRYPGSDGYHRTNKEHGQRGNLGQMLYGGRLQFEFPFGIVGATGYRTRFDRYIKASDQAYARYDFEGETTSTVGFDYTLLVGPVLIFGEVARSRNGGLGGVTGIESSLGSDTEMAVAYRNYQKTFQSVLGNGFGEVSGNPKNEEGIYLGLQHTIGDKVTLHAYMDQFRFPAPRFGTHQPTKGYDWLGKAEVEVSPELEFYVQLRSETKEDEYEATDALGRQQRLLDNTRRSNLRANLSYWVNDRVRLRTRGEWVQSRAAGEQVENGYLLYQDLRLLLKDNLKIDTRISVFDTHSYAARVYQYENDLLYVFASQMLYDRGQRMYLLLNYEPFDFLEGWAKIGITKYEDKQVIGSGLNQIKGDFRSEIGIQLRFKF
ncbi:ComEA family DNA-binding protein [Fodinibius salsisoli]|uniref:Helix-hairpin-helix domain-containing protein n=1 Tax=Fodinibius salsisoli TaxID=2820877 RepID=A0ABT3PJK2_9BACT|nr:helix-hairpin-helix domain-containing protein [Fodinibius salsisoli]MCW9706045.1 helix-hairpin-helix domain-containing protein [Fodinibius salsisoli]